jgi:hypothetical protein
MLIESLSPPALTAYPPLPCGINSYSTHIPLPPSKLLLYKLVKLLAPVVVSSILVKYMLEERPFSSSRICTIQYY